MKNCNKKLTTYLITLYNNIIIMDINSNFKDCILNENKEKYLTKKTNIFNIIPFSFMSIINSLCL